MQTCVRDTLRISFGGFDPNVSARENVERYNTYRRTSGGGGGGGKGGNGKGGLALVLLIALALLALLNKCVSPG